MKPVVRCWKIARFCVYALWELVLSNLRVARAVLLPNRFMKPGIVAVPLDVRSDAEIFILANVITLTPGTISMDVSKDRKYLYVHGMFIEDRESFRRDIKQGFERMIREMFE